MSDIQSPEQTSPFFLPAEGRRLRAVLLGLGDRPEVGSYVEASLPKIQEMVDVVLTDLHGGSDLSSIEADLAIVIGGDGAILHSANRLMGRRIPVLGVNMGKLGFLADLSPEELLGAISDLCAGRCRVVNHLMFECRIVRDGKEVARKIGLNEVAILRGAPFSILNVNLFVDSQPATTFSGDGLIISTPVGSTAHALSAGGPILRRDLDAFVIVPISPHALTVRSVVDSSDRQYEMAVASKCETVAAVVDGQVLAQLTSADRVCVARAKERFKMIEVPGHNYYHTLREKLDWGGHIRGMKWN